MCEQKQQMLVERLKFTVSLPVRVYREGNLFVADCPLDVVSQGDTEARALESLAEAIQLFMISCYERGVLVDVLKDSGFRPGRPGETDDSFFEGAERLLDVPLPLLVAQSVQANDPHYVPAEVGRPTLSERACGGWLAVSPVTAPIRFGVTGPTKETATEGFSHSARRWVQIIYGERGESE